MSIKIDVFDAGGNLGRVLWAKADTFDESKWLGDRGWLFLGRRTSPELKEKLSGIPINSRWLPANKFAVAARIWGKPRIEWSPEARTIVEAKAEAQAASEATDAQIQIPAPPGLEYRPYQRAGVAAALRAFSEGRRGILFGDEMGLGKTMQAIGTLRLIDARQTLIVCPASLRTNWKREIEKWFPELGEPMILNGDLPKTDQGIPVAPLCARVTIINYDKATSPSWENEIVKKALLLHDFDLVVFDEAHFLKNPKAQRTVYFFGKYSRDTVAEQGIIHKCDKRLLLTGTPIQNTVKESLPLIQAIDGIGEGKIAKSGKDFLFRYCGPQKIHTKRNGKKKVVTHFSGATRLDELQAKLRSGFMVRRLKREVEKELPPKLRSVVTLNNKNEELFADRPAVLDDLDDFRAAVAQLTRETAGFSEISALRAKLAKAKISPAIEFIHDLDCDKILIFGHHQVLLDGLEKEFAGAVIRIDGNTPVSKRQDLVDQFQTDENIRIALLSTHAAGVGLTLTAAKAEVFIESDWNPSWAVQAEDRAHRIGQQADKLPIYYLVLDRTLDAHVISTMVRKLDIADRALDTPAVPDSDKTAEDDGPPITETKKEERKERRTVKIKVKKGMADIIITDARKEAVCAALRHMVNRCDGARAKDGSGFNGNDAHDPFVQSLVSQAIKNQMSDKQAAYGLKILYKYRNTQLIDFTDALFPEDKDSL